MHIYGILEDGNDNPICKTEKETQMYRVNTFKVLHLGKMCLQSQTHVGQKSYLSLANLESKFVFISIKLWHENSHSQEEAKEMRHLNEM